MSGDGWNLVAAVLAAIAAAVFTVEFFIVALREGKIVFFIVGIGSGFLGGQGKDIAVPVQAVQFKKKDQNTWMPVLNMSKDAVQNAPKQTYEFCRWEVEVGAGPRTLKSSRRATSGEANRARRRRSIIERARSDRTPREAGPVPPDPMPTAA